MKVGLLKYLTIFIIQINRILSIYQWNMARTDRANLSVLGNNPSCWQTAVRVIQ